jgi:hypothetical protein
MKNDILSNFRGISLKKTIVTQGCLKIVKSHRSALCFLLKNDRFGKNGSFCEEDSLEELTTIFHRYLPKYRQISMSIFGCHSHNHSVIARVNEECSEWKVSAERASSCKDVEYFVVSILYASSEF